MLHKVRQAVELIAALLVLAAMVGVLYLLARGLYGAFKSLDADVAKTVVSVFGAVLVSIFTIFGARMFEARQSVKRDLQEKRKGIYEEFIKQMFVIMGMRGETAQQQAQESQAMLDFFTNFTENMVVWGSDDLLREWSTYKNRLATGAIQAEEVMVGWVNLVLAMRKDLGHRNKGLGGKDILKTFINEPDEWFDNLPTLKKS